MASPLIGVRVRPEVLAKLQEVLEIPASTSGADTLRVAITHLTKVEPSQLVARRGGRRPGTGAKSREQSAAA